MFLLLLLSLILVAAGDGMDVWILAGQSNMVGENNIDDGDPEQMPDCGTPWPGRIFTYPPAANYGKVFERHTPSSMPPSEWMVARPNICLSAFTHHHHPDLDIERLGPGLAFAKRLIMRNASLRVGFVPMGLGGTSLYRNWLPDFVYHLTALVPRAMEAAGPNARLRGMLWVQGETDAQDDPDARPPARRKDWAALGYGHNLYTLVEIVRNATRAYDPCLPIIIGVIQTEGRERVFPHIQVVRQAQLDFSAHQILKIDMAEKNYEMFEQNTTAAWGWTGTIPEGADVQLVHLTKKAQCEFGSDMADLYLDKWGADGPRRCGAPKGCPKLKLSPG
ncbi:hypothetical protein FOA52_009290 [Chlamydomonas sp. UWO 241]|nr:hypothetical protein FOA52_009290 [Chlamydomonas sp. UWO 241]